MESNICSRLEKISRQANETCDTAKDWNVSLSAKIEGTTKTNEIYLNEVTSKMNDLSKIAEYVPLGNLCELSAEDTTKDIQNVEETVYNFFKELAPYKDLYEYGETALDIITIFLSVKSLIKTGGKLLVNSGKILSEIEKIFQETGGGLKLAIEGGGKLGTEAIEAAAKLEQSLGKSIKDVVKDSLGLGSIINRIESEVMGEDGTKTSYVKSIGDLKNTDKFRSSALKHILEGEINGNDMAVGYHYEKFPTSKGKIINGTKSAPNDLGVYTGKVEIDGKIKKAKSSFFPEEWSAQDVVDAINEAYNNKQFIKGSKNTFRGKSAGGLKIEMYIDNNGNIISAFPKY